MCLHNYLTFEPSIGILPTMPTCEVTVVYRSQKVLATSTRMVTSDSCNSSYQSSGSMPKETESTSSESTVTINCQLSLLDRLKAPTRSELSRKCCVHIGHNGD